MKKPLYILMILAAAFVVAHVSAQAQDLGKLATKTREQRMKTMQQKSVRIFNNDNMPKRPASEGPTAAAGMAPAPPQGTAAGAEFNETPPVEPPPSDTSEVDSMRDQIKKDGQSIKAMEERLRLAEDELSLMQVQQASELSPDTQAALGPQIKDKTSAVAALRQEIADAKKKLEKLEKDFKTQGGTLEEKK